MRKNQSIGDKGFNVVITVIVAILSFVCLWPFLNIASIALSSNSAIISGKVSFYPIGIQTDSFAAVLGDSTMWRSFRFTVLLTAIFTALSVVATICAAYPLSHQRLRGKTGILLFITFTMFFSGGLIPNYLLVRGLGMMNSMWSLILPGLISTWFMIIMKSFFNSIPDELGESARIDGANDIVILLRIILPVSKPVIAAISLFYAVGRWNGFQDAAFFINDPQKYPLQLVLNQIVMRGQVNQMMTELLEDEIQIIPESIKAASLLFVTLPIILIYPWLQKYFIKGIMLGSIKG